jgi:AraC-like DNA-binding protein
MPGVAGPSVREHVTLNRQVSGAVSVRSWHNRGDQSIGGTAAHSTIEVAWTEGGTPTEYTVGGETLVLRPASLVVIPSNVEHRTTIGSQARVNVIAVESTALDEMAEAMGVLHEVRASVTQQAPRLISLCRLILQEAAEVRAGHEIVLDALTEALAVEVLRAHSPAVEPARRGVHDPRIRRAVGFIEASFAEPLSLDRIAKVAGMSRFHFGRMFEAEVGKSPYRYLVDVRLACAATLLKSGKVSVTQTAFRVGYSDLGRFGRAFRAKFGMTPRDAVGSTGRSAIQMGQPAERSFTARSA